MNIKKLNSYMIIYIFLDFINFLKEIQKSTTNIKEKNIINNDIKRIESYIILYLKQCIGKNELNFLLKEFQNM